VTAPRCAHFLQSYDKTSESVYMPDVCLRGSCACAHALTGHRDIVCALQALNQAVKGMARKYTGVDGRNRDEREKLYFDRFRLVHKKARHRVSAAAAGPAGQPAAEPGIQRAASGASSSTFSTVGPQAAMFVQVGDQHLVCNAIAGTPPQQATLTPANLMHVHSQPIRVKSEALPAAHEGAAGQQ
jgi:hypothetical protein